MDVPASLSSSVTVNAGLKEIPYQSYPGYIKGLDNCVYAVDWLKGEQPKTRVLQLKRAL